MTPMTSPGTRPPTRTPGKIKGAAALLWLHAAIQAFATFTVFMEAASKHEHGQSGAGVLLVTGALSAGLTGGLALSAAQVMRGVPWARYLAIALESLFLFGGLIQGIVLLTAPDLIGGVVTVAILAVVGVIMSLLLLGESREWFDARVL